MRSIILTDRYYITCRALAINETMKSISLKLPDPLHAQLERLSQERGAAKSDVIRDALEAYFSGAKNGTRVSCLDLASDLAGVIDGPSDLATNPKYMQGFGE